MELVSKDFGTGLLEYLARNPLWDASVRMPVHVPFAAAEEEHEPRRRPALALVPFLAAFVAALTG